VHSCPAPQDGGGGKKIPREMAGKYARKACTHVLLRKMAEEMTVTTYTGGEHISKRRRREHITAPQDGGGDDCYDLYRRRTH
jgi:hypothetical protein